MQKHRKQVREIPANPFLQNQNRGKRLRVAAYCRVSTEQEEQESSFENQVEYYTNLIRINPDWECAGIFADRGISGTKDTIRPEFMRMIEECKKHKIDLILTKSLSRFSRNTLDSITYIRLLKSLNVAVEFEKEGLNTSDVSSEIYLTWFSAFAQAESESISQNVTMGMRRRYKEGKFAFHYSHFLGYRKGADGEPEIEPEGAAVVTRIFYSYLGGKALEQIAAELEQDHILTPRGKETWSRSTILNMLRNEKYAGDVLLQKPYTSDFLQKKVKKNRGEVAQYYITDNHPAIIPREIFQEVQLEIARRNSKRKVSCRRTKSEQGKYTSKFALSERLVCGECGAMYRRTQWIKRDGTREHVWRCINRLEFGKKYCRHSPSLKEPILHEAILNCIRSVYHSKEEILQAMQAAEKKVLFIGEQKEDPETIRQKIQHIEQEMGSLLVFAAQSEKMEMFEEQFKAMTREKTELAEKLQQLEAQAPAREEKGKLVEAEGLSLSEFDDNFIRRVVEQVTVLSAEQIEVRLHFFCQLQLGCAP